MTMMTQPFMRNRSSAANKPANSPRVARSRLLVKLPMLMCTSPRRRRLPSRGAGVSGLHSQSQESPEDQRCKYDDKPKNIHAGCLFRYVRFHILTSAVAWLLFSYTSASPPTASQTQGETRICDAGVR